ncbi:MAG: hypothetical protein FWG98_11735 [Candidatus Cloacimonetes bacterium]|nr:hypothetical protein [Candidatus Cloacimonadota bacterium]
MVIPICLFIIFLCNCAGTPLTRILFYNDTDIIILNRPDTIHGNNEERVIDIYNSFIIVSPGNSLFPEFGENRIYRNLRQNGYHDRNLMVKIIVDNEEYIITPETLAYFLFNRAIYDYQTRRYYIRITDLLDYWNINIQNVDDVIIVNYNPR